MKTVLTAILLLMPLGVACASDRDPAAEVRETFGQFIQAFDNLDWDHFIGFFSEDATMFQPRRFWRRAGNKAEIESQFREIFPQIRGSQTKPPFMDLQPRDLRVQMLGTEAAIVTFHLDDRPGMLNRRTIVLQHFKSGWKIVHIHASELPK